MQDKTAVEKLTQKLLVLRPWLVPMHWHLRLVEKLRKCLWCCWPLAPATWKLCRSGLVSGDEWR